MTTKRFDVKKLAKLNNPKRLVDIPVDTLLEIVQPESTDVMVDIGAGTAFFSIAFLEKAKCSTLYACDVAETMIEWINENVIHKHPEIKPLIIDGKTVPIEDGVADIVFMINLFHELDDHLALLNESCRLLKSGGKVLIVDWKKEEMDDGPPISIRYNTGTVDELLSQAGFSKVVSSNTLEKHFVIAGTKG